jgi:hypothetical protein
MPVPKCDIPRVYTNSSELVGGALGVQRLMSVRCALDVVSIEALRPVLAASLHTWQHGRLIGRYAIGDTRDTEPF